MPSKRLATQAVPLLYPGAPLGVSDLIMQQVRREECRFPHYEQEFDEETMRKELPPTKYPLAMEHNLFYGMFRKTMSLLTP
jgi:hypothetical protein